MTLSEKALHIDLYAKLEMAEDKESRRRSKTTAQ